jgi:hypothetical protein
LVFQSRGRRAPRHAQAWFRFPWWIWRLVSVPWQAPVSSLNFSAQVVLLVFFLAQEPVPLVSFCDVPCLGYLPRSGLGCSSRWRPQRPFQSLFARLIWSSRSAPISYGARVCLRAQGRQSVCGSTVRLSFSSRWFLGPVAGPSCHFSLRVPGLFGSCGGSRRELLLPVFGSCAADPRFFCRLPNLVLPLVR